MKRALLLAGLFSSGCSWPQETLWLRVELPPERAGDSESRLRVVPTIAEASRRVGRGVVALQLKRKAGALRLELPGACPLRLDVSQLPGEGASATFRPLFDAGASERVVGLARAFELTARPNCAEAQAASASFAVTGGAALAAVDVGEHGRRLRGSTVASLPEPAQVSGIVPISARQQAELRTEITLWIEQAGQPTFKQTYGVSALARSSGLPNVGLSHPILLSDEGWQLRARPIGSRAELRKAGSLSELTPDVSGIYRLSSPGGRELSLQSGRYDQTPLDCGRSECHAELTRAARASPMTNVLASDLGGCHALSDPECASACHATGEPGTEDGGFSHVARELGLPALPREHSELPRALERVGGVGCLACHGPGAIPEPSGRWAILRSDVCAVCHDAPPRYGHVAAFRATRMSQADHSEETRAEPCARCHTTWGALQREAPPPEAGALGLGCATCHDPHPRGTTAHAGQATEAAFGLLREYALPPSLPEPPVAFSRESRVCVGCHSPSSSSGRPEASAALLVAGQGGHEPVTGAALSLPGPHANGPKGCLTCHDSSRQTLVLGASHGFRADQASCEGCHRANMQRDPGIAKRALGLLSRLDPASGVRGAERPWHATTGALPPSPQRARALRDVLLVLEDPAADVHHPAYARALLDAAERVAPGVAP